MGRELERSRPFYFRGCDLTAEYLLAMEEVRAQLPAAAPFMHRLVRDLSWNWCGCRELRPDFLHGEEAFCC